MRELSTTCPQCGEPLPPRLGMCPRCLARELADELTPVPSGPVPAIEGAVPTLAPGSDFEGYEILEVLGSGGMGTVYGARQRGLDRAVALKVLIPRLARSREFVRRFEREAKLLAGLNHPNVVQVFASGKKNDFLYLAMEKVEGASLEDRLRAQPRPSLPEFLGWIADACEGLQEVHRASFVHRDLKPSNILISIDGKAKLSDFGLAIEQEDATRLTETGTMLGTPQYMSPEQVLGNRIDARSDLYSLGVILHQGVEGRLPFEAVTPMAVLLKHAHEPPPTVGEHAPLRLKRLILRLLSKNPDDRPQQANEVRDELRRILDARAPQDRRRFHAPLAAAVLLAILAAGWFLWPARPPTPLSSAGPKAEPSWQPLFDGSSLDFMTTESRAGWTLREGALVLDGSRGRLESREEFGDGQIRIRFRAAATEWLSIRVRESTVGAYEVVYNATRPASFSSENELIFSCSGERVSATTNRLPVPVAPDRRSSRGRIVISADNVKEMSILGIDFRPGTREVPPKSAELRVDLLKLIDPDLHSVHGRWTKVDGALLSPNLGRISLLKIPYEPPQEYDLIADVERIGPLDPALGSYSVDFGMDAYGRQFGVVLASRGGSADGGPLNALNMVDGMWAGDPAATYHSDFFKSGGVVKVRIAVRRDNLLIAVNGRPIITWSDYSRLSRHPAYRIPGTTGLFLAAWLSYRFTRLEVVPVF